MRWLEVCAVALATSGCHVVFGIEGEPPPPMPDARLCEYKGNEPTGDPDVDGLISTNDNCPDVSNIDQSDEDGDCLGDRCDACPWVAGGLNVDLDGDGVSGECDPNDASPSLFVVFDNFTDPATTQGWTSGSDAGPWVMQDGAFTVNNAGLYYAVYNHPLDAAHLDTTFRIDADTLRGNGEFLVGLETYAANPDPQLAQWGYAIGVARDANGAWLRVASFATGTFTTVKQVGLVDETTQAPLPIDGPLRLHITPTLNSTVLQVKLWVDGHQISTDVTRMFGSANDTHGLIAVKTPAKFAYFGLVY